MSRVDEDEIAAAVRHYYAANPGAPIPDCEPVDQFPPLSPGARTRHPSQWVKMRQAVVRLSRHPADPGHILAFEAGTYIAKLQAGCAHRRVTVDDGRQAVYTECALCGQRRRP